MNIFLIIIILAISLIIIAHETGFYLKTKQFIYSGNIITESRDINNFNKIDFDAIGSLTIKQEAQENLTIQANENIISNIYTTVNNGLLTIKTDNKIFFKNRHKINITISVKDLKEISLRGIGSIKINNLEVSSLKILLSGIGSLKIQKLITDDLDAKITGLGSLKIKSGTATNQTILLSGCGSLNSKNLFSKTGTVTISGCGSAKVNINQISVKKTGLGSITNFACK